MGEVALIEVERSAKTVRLLIPLILVLLINGCAKGPYRDPYVAAINNYMADLNSADYRASDELRPPPEPSYLSCPAEPEPFPTVGQANTSYGVTNELQPRLSTRSTAQCEQINSQRKQAYETALKEYRGIASDDR